jgi:glycine betaine/proline transport system permease protein
MEECLLYADRACKLPVGQIGEAFFAFLNREFDAGFDLIKWAIGATLQGIIAIGLWPHPIVVMLLAAALAFWLQRSLRLAAGVALGLFFIYNQGFWKETIETLALVLGATATAMAIGVPLGILAARRPPVYAVMRPILDLMQTLPTFCYLIPALVLFGLGLAPGMIATVIFALPAPVRMTYLGITSVPRPLVEAALAFGATRWQLLTTVELRQALPTIMAGLTQCIMLSLSMVVIAALVGANGLGKPVVRALNQVNIPMGIEAGLAIVVLAIILDRMTQARTLRAAG